MQIIVKNVNKSFKHKKIKKYIFENASFTIKSNIVTSIIGANGIGKTTLGLIIAGLSKFEKGTINYVNDNVTIVNKGNRQNFKKIRKFVSIAFQLQDEQFLKNTVFEEIIFYTKQTKYNKNFLDKRVSEIMSIVNLDLNKKTKSPYRLSSGEKRKVIIASLLFHESPILILDEPTANLDLQTKKNIVKLIKDLKELNKYTILIISHDTDFLFELSDETILIKNSKEIIINNSNIIFNDVEELDKVNVSIPSIISIMNELKIKDNSIKTVEELAKKIYQLKKH